MKNKVLIASFSLAIFFITNAFAQNIIVMTYNIRVDIPFDTANSWNNRKDMVTGLLDFYQPDIIGTQEGLNHQLQYIKDGLKTYDFVGKGRTDGGSQGEYTAIFYNRNRFEVISDSTFWLSQTPEMPSRGWDAAYDRICTYALLKDKVNGSFLWIFNTHLDNVGAQARSNSAKLIMERIKGVLMTGDYPVLFMGDLNCEESDEPVQIFSSLLTDCKTNSVKKPYGPEGTFNGFDTNSELKRRIDFIFTSKDSMLVHKYASIDDRYGPKWPSDHLPVLVALEMK